MHTPGPWCFEAENGCAHPRVYGADNSLIAEVGNANLMRWEVWDHDARLIAAAPELLAALRAVIAANGEFRAQLPDAWDGDPVNDACMAAQAVIAKATEPRP